MSKLKPYWHKIILNSIPIYMVGFLLFGSLSIILIKQKSQKTAQAELVVFTQEKKLKLQELLQIALGDISIIADNQKIRELGLEISNQKKELIVEDNRLTIIEILKNKPLYSGLVFLTNSTEIIFRLDESLNLTVTYHAGIAKELNSISLIDPKIVAISDEKDPSTIKSVYAITPINQDNTNQTMVAVVISGMKLQEITNVQPDKSFNTNIYTDKDITNHPELDINPKNLLFKDDWVELDGARLNIKVEKNLAESYAKINKLAFQIAIIGFIILIVMVLLNTYIVQRTLNPLELLKESIEQLESGNNEAAQTYQSSDIVGWLGNSFSRMIMQIKHNASQLDERNERLKHFYLATTDGIYIHNSGIPLIFNPALRNLTGYNEQELQKLQPSDFLIIDEDVLQAAHDQRFSLFEAELKTKEGAKLQVEVQLNDIIYRGQKAESLVIRDITHRKSIEQELQQERKRQVKSVIDGQEKERQRLSRELHDGLGQNLVAIKLKLESISAEKAGELGVTLNQVKQMFSYTIEEIRRISNNLMPAALKEFSLAVVLRNLCTEIESNSGISIGLSIGVLPESIDQILKTYVYRIVQEALTNVVKHSSATKTTVSVFSDFSNLHLHIEDNGSGFNTANLSDSGNGLYNMKERAMLLGGKINIISSKGKGVKIIAEFPLNQSKSEYYV